MTDEWGPWIEHDGTGCPVPVGTKVMVEDYVGCVRETIAGCYKKRKYVGPHGQENSRISAWIWVSPRKKSIIRYRVRKPRGLSILQSIAENPREEVEA
jgi:hypothetical protein